MAHFRRLVALVIASTFLVVAFCWTPSVTADLNEYVKKPEPAFAWKLKEKKADPRGTIYDLHLVSQVWEEIPWEHQLQIYQPPGAEPAETMLLFNTGGNAREERSSRRPMEERRQNQVSTDAPYVRPFVSVPNSPCPGWVAATAFDARFQLA